MNDFAVKLVGIALGFAAALAVFGIAQVIAERGNPFEAEDRAMPFGPALSPSVEPLRVSMASPLQSLSQGERP